MLKEKKKEDKFELLLSKRECFFIFNVRFGGKSSVE